MFNVPARRQRAVKCKMALTSQKRSWCVLEFHKTNSVVTVQRAFKLKFNPYPTAFPYGNGMVLHFYQQQESSTTKTVHKVNNKGLKTYV